MRRAGLIAVVALTTGPGSPVRAQAPVGLAYFSIGVYGGGSSITDFQRQDLQLTGPEDGVSWFEQIVAAEPTAMVGAAATIWPARHWGVRSHIAFGATDLALQRGGVAAALPDVGGTELGIWLYDLTVVLRVPSVGSASVMPYVVVGGGGVRYRLHPLEEPGSPTWLFGDDASRTRLAGVAGVGVDVPLQRHGLSLAFELVNHFTRTPVEVRHATLRLGDDGRPVSAAGPARGVGPAATREINIVNQIRFSAGFTYSLRGQR